MLVSLLLALLLVDAAAGSVLAVQRRDRQRALDEGLRPASATVTGLLKAYVDQETGLRGVITGREEFLEPYDSGRQEERSRSARLRDLLRDEPALLAQVEEVVARGEQWRREAAEPEIAARRAGNTAAAVQTVVSGPASAGSTGCAPPPPSCRRPSTPGRRR